MQFDAKQPDFAKLLSCACLNVRQAARAVTRFYDKKLEPSGVRITQFAVLAVIRVGGAVPLSLLAKSLGLDPNTLSRTMQPLIDRGLVQLETGEDQRIKEATLTASGHRTAATAYELWVEAQSEIGEKVGPERFGSLIRDLSTLTSLKG